MKKEAFKVLHDMEDSWWYRGRENVVRNVLNKFLNDKKDELILDWGAGFGGMLKILSKYGSVSAYELDSEARNFCLSRGYKKVFNSGEEALSSGKFSLFSLFDVVEHVKDDKGLMDSIYNNLVTDGRVIITVPAYQWLWGVHDVEYHHYRRYTRKRIKKLLVDSGFEVEYSSYWNTTLFIPAAITRLLGFSGSSSFSMSPWLNYLFYKIVFIESLLIPFTLLPFGTGIVIIAHKK